MDGLYFWIPRWFKSTAYRELSLEEQGIYLNLLFEATLRDGVLPNDPKVWRNVTGHKRVAKSVLAVVKKHFKRCEGGWRNDTLDEAITIAQRQIARKKRWRDKMRDVSGDLWKTAPRDVLETVHDHDHDLSTPIVPSFSRRSGSGRRKYDVNGSNCSHTPRCRNNDECVHKTLSWDES